MQHGTIIESSFQAPRWLQNPHLQTLSPRLGLARSPRKLLSERLELPDGDFVDLCWCGEGQGPIVAVFHGLEGSIHSPYSRDIMHSIEQQGWRGVFMHFRGCGPQLNRLERSYHSGDTADIAYLLETLRRRYSNSRLAAVGFSLGGNALLKYLGENPRAVNVDAAVAVSVPFLLDIGARRLEEGFSRLYQRYLISHLHKKIRQKYRTRQSTIRLDDLKTLRTFRLFDDRVTAPLHGFAGVDDYYRRASSRQYLAKIETPVLIIHAEDDPFLSAAAIPSAEELGPGIRLELSRHGGHVGFISGKYPWQCRSWLKERIPSYLNDYLE